MRRAAARYAFRFATTRRLLFQFAAIIAFLPCLAHSAWGDAGQVPAIVFTADTEGHTGSCSNCPSGSGLGGLARRASLIARLRQEGPLLLLDGGNAFFGGDSAASEGKVIAAAYDKLGYDAINISYRDFRRGREAIVSLLNATNFTPLSANLLDEKTSQPLFKPYVIKEMAGRKVAIIGVTISPAGLEFLPHLKEQLSGVRIRPAAETLAEWIPKAKAEADQIVLLYYGSVGGLHAIQDQFAGDLTAICVGGIRPELLPPDAKPPVVAAAEHGKSVARAVMNGRPSAATQLAVSPDLPSDEAMGSLLASFVPPVANVQPRAMQQHQPQPPLTAAPSPMAEPTTAPSKGTVTSMPSVTAAPATEARLSVAPTSMAAIPPALPPVPANAPVLKRVSARSSLTPQGLAGVGLSAEQVNLAIEHGRDFLWAHLKTQLATEHRRLGEDNGYDLLQVLALVHTGAQFKYPQFDAELRGMLTRLDPAVRSLGTYETGLACMVIGDYADPVFLPKMRRLTRVLIEQQTPDGSWDYGISPVLPPDVFQDLDKGPALSVEGGLPIDQPGNAASRMDRTLPWGKRQPGDNSVSQFALLGLRAAARVQVAVNADVWSRSLKSFHSRRCLDGAWGYSESDSSSYGSMACAGICAMAIARHELDEKDPTADPDIETGLGWLDNHFSVSANPERNSYTYYYLYSLERVGRILDTEFIGSHEWYPLGAQFLVQAQLKDGSWLDSPDPDPRTATSFALLFLTRATQSLKVELKRGGEGQVTTVVATPPPARLYVILDASGSMLDDMDGRQKFDIARDAAASMFAGLPDSAEVALRVYGHRKRAIEPGADEDTALEFPMAKIDRPKLTELLKRLRPRGKTPLALSLTQAKDDLSSLSGQPVTVVLLTDGGEDTMPRRDPVKAAALFATLNGITFHIVGFDINQEDWGRQLREMAVRARGHYWIAARAGALTRQLRSAVFGIPDDFTLFDSSWREVARGEFGRSAKVPEGKYFFKTNYGGQEFKSDLWVNTGGSTAVVFDASHVEEGSGTGGPARSATTTRSAVEVALHFCTHCGHALPAGAKFCPSCGQPVPK